MSVIEDVEELSFFVEVKLVSVDVEAVVANDVVTVGKYVLVVAIVVVVYVVLVIVVVDEELAPWTSKIFIKLSMTCSDCLI